MVKPSIAGCWLTHAKELKGARLTAWGGMPLVTLREPALDPLQRLTKRLFDLLVGGISFILALPIMGLIALLIKFDSPGPIIFKQQRAGENGRPFKMYKFRTMVHDAEAQQSEIIQNTEAGLPIHKFYDDPRVTHFGRFLRRTSLDELPQLFNILLGQMSLIGPRMICPEELTRYGENAPDLLSVRPGLTGLWQVSGRQTVGYDDRVRLDMIYIRRYSPGMDCIILLRTVSCVVHGTGAY